MHVNTLFFISFPPFLNNALEYVIGKGWLKLSHPKNQINLTYYLAARKSDIAFVPNTSSNVP